MILLLKECAMIYRYSTGLGLSGSDALIQDFYAGECTNPIHLILDTGLTDQRLAIKAFVSRNLTLKKHQASFVKLPAGMRFAGMPPRHAF